MSDAAKPAVKTAAQRKAAERRAKREAGLKPIEVWAHPEDHEPIKGYAAKLAKARAKSAPAKKKAAPKG